jgi:hypothetical protein
MSCLRPVVCVAFVFAFAALAIAQESPARPFVSASSELAGPVKLEAGGAPIDVVKYTGHAGPQAVDFDRDGDLDLLVGTYAGRIVLYRNDGARAEPKLAEGAPLSAAGKEIELRNW